MSSSEETTGFPHLPWKTFMASAGLALALVLALQVGEFLSWNWLTQKVAHLINTSRNLVTAPRIAFTWAGVGALITVYLLVPLTMLRWATKVSVEWTTRLTTAMFGAYAGVGLGFLFIGRGSEMLLIVVEAIVLASINYYAIVASFREISGETPLKERKILSYLAAGAAASLLGLGIWIS